jgi:hypothetical protein
MDIPKDKHYPADAIQCDACGGRSIRAEQDERGVNP